jgi:AbrB family looped-hinge helix DNA binding protein
MDFLKSREFMERAMGRFEAKTSMKGQATIPIEVRKALGLAPGGAVQFIVGDDGKVSVIAKKRGLQHLKGIFGKPDEPVDVDAAIMETVRLRTDPDRKEEDP